MAARLIFHRVLAVMTLVLALMVLAQPAAAYSVLSHEELVDIAWDSDIQPALLHRYPHLTPDELRTAHAYAYGGSLIQDLGYYPFGSHEFTNLLHYARTGDFVANALREARDANEFAFALGALSHYAADVWGHPAVNQGVGLEYPKLRYRYGRLVTYEEAPEAHLKTEFSFDALQVEKGRYDAKRYRDFIGFKVADDLLKRAFEATYGFPTSELLHFNALTISSFRFAVSQLIPESTKVAAVLAAHRQAAMPEKHDEARKVFLYHLSRADYEREYGAEYRRPGWFARFVAFVLRIVGKVGPFRTLAYKDPTPTTEDIYFKSMNQVLAEYRRLVRQVNGGDLRFANRNLDTGELTRAGDYGLADKTFNDLLHRMAKKHFRPVTPELKSALLSFFSAGKPQLRPKDRQRVQAELAQLQAAPVASPPGR